MDKVSNNDLYLTRMGQVFKVIDGFHQMGLSLSFKVTQTRIESSSMNSSVGLKTRPLADFTDVKYFRMLNIILNVLINKIVILGLLFYLWRKYNNNLGSTYYRQSFKICKQLCQSKFTLKPIMLRRPNNEQQEDFLKLNSVKNVRTRLFFNINFL